VYKLVTVFIFVIVSMSITGTSLVFADSIRFPNWPWFCPPSNQDMADPSLPRPSIDKDKDGKPDRKYVHINDSTGHDIQLWCLDHGPTGDFAYYSSAPNRNDIYIAGCLLICGRNFGDILVTANSTVSWTGNNTLGTRLYDVNGTITGYNHTNYVPHDINSTDKGKDYHFHFNSTLGRYTLVRTMIDPATGEHKIAQSGTRIFTPESSDEERVAYAMTVFENVERDPNSTMTGVYSDHDERYFVSYSELGVNLDGQITTFIVPHPVQVKIEQMEFDIETKSLYVTLPPEHAQYFSMSIPRELVDHIDDDQFVILADGEETDFEETTSDTYRTLNFNLPPDAQQVIITGTKAIPEFGPIAVLILVVSILATVTYAKFSRLNFS
jgi:hypothetical protein